MSQQRSKPVEAHQLEPFLQPHRNLRNEGPTTRLIRWRKKRMALRALRVAGDPNLVLDMPCGTGRYWPLLTSYPNRLVLAADSSPDLLAAAQANQPADISERICVLQSSASAIQLGENAVDSIFCMHLLSKLESSDQRLAVLREFYRVTRDTVILSLWVDSEAAWVSHYRVKRRTAQSTTFAVISREQIEAEFKRVGFKILTRLDLVPGCLIWRVYVLRKES